MAASPRPGLHNPRALRRGLAPYVCPLSCQLYHHHDHHRPDPHPPPADALLTAALPQHARSTPRVPPPPTRSNSPHIRRALRPHIQVAYPSDETPPLPKLRDERHRRRGHPPRVAWPPGPARRVNGAPNALAHPREKTPHPFGELPQVVVGTGPQGITLQQPQQVGEGEAPPWIWIQETQKEHRHLLVLLQTNIRFKLHTVICLHFVSFFPGGDLRSRNTWYGSLSCDLGLVMAVGQCEDNANSNIYRGVCMYVGTMIRRGPLSRGKR